MADVTPPDAARPTAPSPDAGPDRFGDWPSPLRWGVYVVVVLLVLGLAAVGGGWWVARRSLPQTDGALVLPGLTGPAVVRRDGHGVPQVYAGSSHDLFEAQGFVQAQDRFWQMDVRRHAASGTLAEIFGSRLLGRDEVARTLGWRQTAQRELGLLDAPTREALDGFSDGVNAYLDQHLGSDNSLEYTLVSLRSDYRPADWTPVDSLACLKLLAWQEAGNLPEEVQRAGLAASPPPSGATSLYPTYPLAQRAPVTGGPVAGVGKRVPATGGYVPGGAQAGQGLLSRLGDDLAAEDPLVAARPGTGGSAWAVAGPLTTLGRPLLAGVPGQEVGLPGAAYQTGLHCTRVSADCPYDVSGFASPGLPGVLSGHTDDVAWSLTALGADTVDLFLEDVDPGSPGTALRAGRREPLTTRTERIRVAGGPSREITVRSTEHGPLLSDRSATLAAIGRAVPVPIGSPARGSGYAVAVRWEGSVPRPSADAILALDRATSVADVRAAARLLSAPASGIVYAGRDSIGYQATGAVPAHARGEGLAPQRGWTDGSAVALVPFARLPHEEDPSSGMVVATGQPPSADTTTLGDSWTYGAKADRVRRLLRDGTAGDRLLDVDDLVRVAADTRSPTAPTLVPYLLDVRLGTAYARQGQRLLRDWDYDQPAASAAAAYYNVVWRNVLALTFDDQLPPALTPDASSRWAQVVAALLRRPDDPWWDDVTTARVETRDDVLAVAMDRARGEMTRLQARDPSRWTWGHLHGLDLERPVLADQGLGRLVFGGERHPAPGGPGAVMDTAYDPRTGYAATAAPAGRLVSDLGDLDRSRWVVLGGASGHVLGPHDTDQVATWLRGATYPWLADPRRIREATQDDVLVLRPR